MIECRTLYGLKKPIPRDRLIIRPSVYGVIAHQGKVLLTCSRRTGKYALPGGGIDAGEPIEDALRREVKEETGIQIQVGEFLRFQESFFYYDPLDEAFHGFLFFYACAPLTFDLLDDDQVEDGEAEKPRWVEIQSLQEGDFLFHGHLMLELLS